MLIYFHGNAEDSGCAEAFVSTIAEEIDCHAVLPEYPSYGVYQSATPTQDLINENALLTFDFFVSVLKFSPKNVVVLGRSLGSGPATFLAANRAFGLLILFSPFKSIQDVAVDHAWIFGRLIKQCFMNDYFIKIVKCPTFFIHGKNDDVIKPEHSLTLFDSCASKFKKLVQPSEMTHNKFSIMTDFVNPLKEFIDEVENSRTTNIQFNKKMVSVSNDSQKIEYEKSEYILPLLFLLCKYKKKAEDLKRNVL